jgi:hypothetical protein
LRSNLLCNENTAGRWINSLGILGLDNTVASDSTARALHDLILSLKKRLVLLALRLGIQRRLGSGMSAAARTRTPITQNTVRLGSNNSRGSWSSLERILARAAAIADKWWSVAAHSLGKLRLDFYIDSPLRSSWRITVAILGLARVRTRSFGLDLNCRLIAD